MHRLIPLSCLALLPLPSRAEAIGADFYPAVVQPLLEANCLECHSHAAGRMKGDLALDSVAAMKAGGTEGPAIVPGKPAESLLLAAVRRSGELKMPPPDHAPPLAAAEIAALETWIRAGAPSAEPAAEARSKITDEDRAWWAFQTPVNHPVPPARGLNGIDAFIGARLEREGLTPAPEADRVALIRRVTQDLIGLPPTAEEVAAFAADPAPGAYERVVDRLLADPRHGERMARGWLDLVRYADSDGYRIDDLRPNAWLYRDYVIRSFNADKPYDRFVREQLAGDELYPGDPDALIATGALRHWIYEYNNRDARTHWATILDDITDTTGDVFLGLGIQCARCHDHKFDPILQKDYFRLRAFFAGLLPRDDLVAATAEEQAAHAAAGAEFEFAATEIRKELSSLEAEPRVAAEREAIGKFPDDIQVLLRKPAAARSPEEAQLAALAHRQVLYEWGRVENRIKGPEKEAWLARMRDLKALEAALKPPPLPRPMAVTDLGPAAAPVFIPKRGGEPVEPAWLEVLGLPPPGIRPAAASTGRRAALADWLTRPGNPFTARVLVNRIWQHHFGAGLAANASDFGRLGEKPSHPELLDWLAVRFERDGWSLRKLHRLIVTSAAYRRSARHPEPAEGLRLDPQNRLLWRAPVRRLDAEQIRDALFAASGELKPSQGGPGRPFGEPQRSIYSTILRNNRDPLLAVFDAPYWFTSTSSRNVTTTPVQSLLLINSSFLLQRAKAMAAAVVREAGTNEAARVTLAYRRALARDPTAAEHADAREFLAAQAGRIAPEQAGSAQAAFIPGRIPYRDGQAAELKPQGPQRRFLCHLGATVPAGDFTVETYMVVRSIFTNASVRTLVSLGEPPKSPGWAFGITGQASRRKPQTLVLHLFGRRQDGTVGEEPVFSDHSIVLDKPYYLGASVRLATTNEAGEVTFFVKDLSNDDEPLQVARVPHRVMDGHLPAGAPLVIGGRGRAPGAHDFDGLVDDVRLTRGALHAGQVLHNSASAHPDTVAYWTFEALPDVFQDASGHAHPLSGVAPPGPSAVDLRRQALADLCHVLLNSNEFLYVE